MDEIKISFKEKKLSRKWSLIYGFQDGKATYDVVFTLERCFKYTYIHGLLSKANLATYYRQLWEFLRVNVRTQYIGFEVLMPHYPAYKAFLNIVSEKDLRTFDGYDSKLLIVKKGSRIK